MTRVFYLIFACNIIFSHPHHISNTEIFFNEKTNRFEISIKVVPDDFENAIKKVCQKTLNIFKTNAETDSCISTYVEKNFFMLVNNEEIKLKYIGSEFSDKEFLIFIESEEIAKPKKVKITNQILFEALKLQVNIIRFKYKKIDKTFRLKNPESVWELKL